MSGPLSMKTCTKCRKEQPLENFRKYSGRSSDGLRPLCKVCQREYEKTWRSQNPEYRRLARLKRAEKAKEYQRKYNAAHRGEILAKACVLRAKRKNLPCDLLDFIPQIELRVQKAQCEMTGISLNLERNRASWNSPSIDRIEPDKGYVMSNIRIVCFAMNTALGSWGEIPLRKIMIAWLERK